MKALFALLLTTAAVSSAHALESHYGRISQKGRYYTCHFTNKTSGTLDFKYVQFSFSRLGRPGDGNSFEVQERIDKRVRSGESVAYTVDPFNVHRAEHCLYLAR